MVYLLECNVCGIQYVGSTCIPFRTRFNNYKACYRKFSGGASGVPLADIFRHFAGEVHRGFLEDIKIIIIDILFGNGRQLVSFRQYNTRQVDVCC